MPRIPGLLERIQQPLYDTVKAKPLQRTQDFFQVSLRPSFSKFEGKEVVGGEQKTLAQTNMEQPSCLPYPRNFEIYGIGTYFDKTADKMDIDAYKQYSYFNLFIGSKDYLNIPLDVLADFSENHQRRNYEFAEPIDLIPLQNFRASTHYHGDKPLDNSFDIKCVLHGFFKREVH
jgi:hypothetical protein